MGKVLTLKSNQHKPKYVFAFYVIAILIPIVFFIIFESALRYFDYGDDHRLFIPAPVQFGNQDYLQTNIDVANRFFSEGESTPAPPVEFFKKNKSENSYRIFVMGGSTAASWPYPRNVLFSRALAQRLSDVFPDKNIEVINTGIAAVNSFTLLDFTDEILAQEPDAVLIYSGHNEFYGALGAGSTESVGQSRGLIKTYLALSKLKTFQLIRSVADSSKQLFMPAEEDRSGHTTLMSKMVGNNSIAYGSEIYLNAKQNYEANLTEMLSKITAHGVSVMLAELVSNFRDHPPFISINETGHLSASASYESANQLYEQQMYDMAKEAYTMAKDHDGLRFRASEDFNDSIYKIAAQFDVPVVPMKAYFEKASPNGIIGKELMLEHLHPNVDGYMLMSDAFFHSMHKHGFINEQWDEDKIKPDQFYRLAWPITELDRALGDIRIINLTDNYPYKPKGPGQRSMANYQPQNIVEELAYKTYQEEMGFTEAHARLAEHYVAQGEHELALREYLALISSEPFTIGYYMMASDFLIKYKQYDRALPILLASLEISETGYVHKQIGQVLLIMQRPAEARKYLETALSYFPEDEQVIYNLGFVDITFDQIENAEVAINLLRRIAPQSNQLKSLTALFNKHLKYKQSAEVLEE